MIGITSVAAYRIVPVLLVLIAMGIRVVSGGNPNTGDGFLINAAVYGGVGLAALCITAGIVNTIRNRAYLKAGTKRRGFFIAALVCTSVATLEAVAFVGVWALFWFGSPNRGD
ncbi:MAG: hypothetical protein KGL72_04100 [Actinomycetales bacterium]|nr:hypothetical protein [Actinomycetales bacterium]